MQLQPKQLVVQTDAVKQQKTAEKPLIHAN